MGDIIVIAVLAVVVAFAVRSLMRQRKKGGCAGCSCGCGSCQGCTRCGHASEQGK